MDKRKDFIQLIDKLDLHEIEQLKLIKQAITYLTGQKRSLEEKIAGIDQQISFLKDGSLDPRKALPRENAPKPSTGTSPKQPRAARQGSLPFHIIEIMQAHDGPMTIQNIATALTNSGYRSKSKNLNATVAATLHQMRQTERVGKGCYRLVEPSTTPTPGS